MGGGALYAGGADGGVFRSTDDGTTWAPISDCGFSSTGFMCTLGRNLAARACVAWARPISPPSTVTAALFDMFCGLNGATPILRRRKTRPKPATSVLLPASDVVPCTISVPVFMGKLSHVRI